jgi:hypothetical protein
MELVNCTVRACNVMHGDKGKQRMEGSPARVLESKTRA